jgi:predicted transcriptional regulator
MFGEWVQYGRYVLVRSPPSDVLRHAPDLITAGQTMIGALETEVLTSLRDLGEAPARDVRKHLEQNGTRLAYTTVATILSRLFEKGLVRRRRETCRGGERYLYRPADVEQKYLINLLKGVVAMFGPAGVVHLNEEIAKLNPSEERELRRRLGMD